MSEIPSALDLAQQITGCVRLYRDREDDVVCAIHSDDSYDRAPWPCHERDVVAALIEADRKAVRADERVRLREFADSLTNDKDPETDTRIFDPWDVAQMIHEYAAPTTQEKP